MNFQIGCDLVKFREHYPTCGRGPLAKTEENILLNDPSHCILWMEGQNIIGHVLWHECSTSEHKKGDPRDIIDRKILELIFGEDKHLIELHEVWLKEEHRGKGYGNDFFNFFENYIKKKGFNKIIYYTDHPAAIRICRKRNYKEETHDNFEWTVFGKILD